MGKARNRAERTGSMDVVIGTTKLVPDSSGDLEVKDTSNNRKKIIASELKLGSGNDVVIIKRNSSTGAAQFQSSSDGGSSTTEQSIGGAGTVTNASDLPITGNQAGDLKLVTSTNNLMIHNGSGWYKIATITNASPTISSAGNASYAFALDGTPVSIEIVASDPEGAALQYKYQVTTGSLGSTAAVTNSATSGGTYSALAANTLSNNRFFKVTPSTNNAHAGSFAITFSVTDGINTANSSASSFTLVFETFGSTSMQLNAAYNTAGTDHIEVASHSDFTLGTNNFTIEGWFFMEGPASNHDYPGSQTGHRGSVGYTPHLFDFRELDGAYSNKRAPMVYIGGAGGNNAQAGSKTFRYHVTGSDRITSSVKFPEIENQWFHFAIVRNSGTTTMYIDGVSEGTWSDSTNYDEIDKLWIGRHGYSANHNFLGWISNFRIVNGTAVYTANFTPPTAPLTAIANTKLLTCTKPDAVDDRSPTGHTITKVGSATHAAFNPFPWATTGYGSLFFDKNNDNLTYEAGGGNAVTGMTALTDLTVELWVYHFAGHSDDTTDPSAEEVYVHFTDNLYGGQQMTFGRYRASSSTCPMYVSTHGNPWQNVVKTDNAAHDVNRGAWYHLAWVKQGTNLRMYKNGNNVEGNNGTSSTSALATLRVGEIHIGETSGASYDMLGYMSNLRISNNARYTSDFTPSTTPFSNDSNTILLTCQNSVPAKTTNGAYHFTTTSSRLLAESADFNLASSTPFTIEYWYQLKSGTSNSDYMFSTGTGGFIQLYLISGNIKGYASNMGGYWVDLGSGVGRTEDVWYHVAITGDGSGNTKVYLDGTQKGSTHNGSWAVTGGKIRINGYAGSGYTSTGMVAYFSDFRIVNGTQVYSGNFTRPSGALTTTGGTYPSNTNVNTSITASHTKLLTCQNSSGALVDNSASNHTLTMDGTVTPIAGVEKIAPEASSNSFDLTVNGDVRNVKYWPFSYNG
tara:strand:+ start:1334 stop:4231 length:2898 start_codon:yes stop_codon:yes gene_type:complete